MTTDDLLVKYADRVGLREEDVAYLRRLIADAVLAEREACAVVAEGADDVYGREAIAAAIRARAAP